jgi:hypothetical protein
MRKRYAVLLAVLLTVLATGCGGGAVTPPPPDTSAPAEANRGLPREPDLPSPHTWVNTDGGQVRLTGWAWQDSPPNTAGRPVHGAWLVIDAEVQATSVPLWVSLWDWRCLGAYDGVLVQAVATPLHAVWDVSLPVGVSTMGQVACDPNPGQAVIVQWVNPAAPQGPQPAWLVPSRE